MVWAVAVLAAAATVTLGASRLRGGAPVVERSAVVIGTVSRGEMVRQVRGQGTLVPTEVRLITAETAARVERVCVAPGDRVEAGAPLVVLSNPDLELRALEAERELAQARAHLVELQATLDNQHLAQESDVATVEGELADASRRAQALATLHAQGAVPELEKHEALGRAETLTSRLAFEQKRLAAVGRSSRAQIDAQRSQIDRLADLVAFARRQVAGLAVGAPAAGVVQEVPLQPGQSVATGQLLAKLVDPTRLKAELRVPEAQFRGVRAGLAATIDTRAGVVPGRVVRIDPAASGGTIRVDIALDGALPPTARPDLGVEGVIEIERLVDVLHVGRPAFGDAGARVTLFRLDRGGDEAARVAVELGKTSVGAVEIVSGLREGDSVILSDLGRLDSVDRIRLQ